MFNKYSEYVGTGKFRVETSIECEQEFARAVDVIRKPVTASNFGIEVLFLYEKVAVALVIAC